MRLFLPSRAGFPLAAIALALALPACAQSDRTPPDVPFDQGRMYQGPMEHRASPANQRHPHGDHLPEWMRQHSELTPAQQQRALAQEPGFKELPTQTRQQMLQRLAQLNAMPPEKRERLLERNEAMERLNPAQREQVRSAMKQLADLPPDQRRYVDRTFRGLRELPPQQRMNVLNSERFKDLTGAQRSTLNNLMAVEPLLPPPYDAQGAPPPPPPPPPR